MDEKQIVSTQNSLNKILRWNFSDISNQISQECWSSSCAIWKRSNSPEPIAGCLFGNIKPQCGVDLYCFTRRLLTKASFASE